MVQGSGHDDDDGELIMTSSTWMEPILWTVGEIRSRCSSWACSPSPIQKLRQKVLPRHKLLVSFSIQIHTESALDVMATLFLLPVCQFEL